MVDQAQGRDHDYALVDLLDHPLPLMDAEVVPAAAEKAYADSAVQRWSDTIDAFDGYIFVTPEYNSNVPGPFKNAFDCLGQEWAGKPIAFVGYSFGNSRRVLESWRMSVTGSLKMQAVDAATDVDLAANFADAAFTPTSAVLTQLQATLEELEAKLG
ncbi:NADPH-dependent FMN reductase [Corynebacterium lizhenjunii]|uniref:NADPH-dependent FMN reductase n=1 Tax=Corynebacterium lizhenjunii TaxID=2709394 RepID=UPI0013EBDE12|nr:NAD(P)H-dependent oxidoreductase [Corynebacterium lizhenjunii]